MKTFSQIFCKRFHLTFENVFTAAACTYVSVFIFSVPFHVNVCKIFRWWKENVCSCCLVFYVSVFTSRRIRRIRRKTADGNVKKRISPLIYFIPHKSDLRKSLFLNLSYSFSCDTQYFADFLKSMFFFVYIGVSVCRDAIS